MNDNDAALTADDRQMLAQISRHIHWVGPRDLRPLGVLDRMRHWLLEKLAGEQSFIINAQFNADGWPITVQQPMRFVGCDMFEIDRPYIRVLGPGERIIRPSEIAATRVG